MPDMPDDPFQSDEWKAYADRCLNELRPKMENSTIVVSMVPKTRSDVKFAVEMGFAVLMDKPIIAVIAPGTKVSSKLLAVADQIMEYDLRTGDPEEFSERLRSVVDSFPLPDEEGDDD